MEKTIILLVVSILLSILLFLVYYYNLLPKFTISEFELPPSSYFYLTYSGDYSKMNGLLSKIRKDLLLATGVEADGQFSSTSLSSSTLCVIYYDSVSGRATAGVLVSKAPFLEKRGYRKFNSRGVAVVGAVFPLNNFLNVVFGALRGIPALKAYVKEKGKKEKQFRLFTFMIIKIRNTR